MNATANAEPRIETYLRQVRAALRGLHEPEIDDILRELRSLRSARLLNLQILQDNASP